MTTYESTSGSIVHVELNSDDPEATRALYEEAFGWAFESMEEDAPDVEGMEAYTSWRAPNPPNGGLVDRSAVDGPFVPPSTLFYVQVDDIAATGAAIAEAGGDLLVEEMELPDMGAFTVYRDPGGVVAAAWEDRYEGEPPEGGWPLLTDEPEPGSIVHFELYTAEPAATRAFHEAVFGWGFEAIADGAYTMVRPPTPPNGGVMEATEEMPPGVLLYLLVPSAEGASRTVEGADGRVTREPFDVEGWGTMAVFEAPGGVVQAVWEAATGSEDAGAGAAEPSAD